MGKPEVRGKLGYWGVRDGFLGNGQWASRLWELVSPYKITATYKTSGAYIGTGIGPIVRRLAGALYAQRAFVVRLRLPLAAAALAFVSAQGFALPAAAQASQPVSIPYAAPERPDAAAATSQPNVMRPDVSRPDIPQLGASNTNAPKKDAPAMPAPESEALGKTTSEKAVPPVAHMGTIRIGLHDGIPPYVISAPLKGMDISILESVFARTGYKVDFVLAPVRRLPIMFENGQIDAYTTYEQTPAGAFASLPFRHWHDGVIVRRGLGITRDNIDDWNVGTFPGAVEVMGEVLGPYTEAVRTGTVAESSIQAAKLFSGGRIDAYVGDVFTFFYHYRSVWGSDTPLPQILEFFRPFAQRLIFADEAMQKRFDAALLEARRDGVIEQIFVDISLDTLTSPKCAYRDPFEDESDLQNLKDLTKGQAGSQATSQAQPKTETC